MTSSVCSAGSGHHHGVRHRKASRATIEEEVRAGKRAEDLYEILIPNEMTLAAVKNFKWKGGGELDGILQEKYTGISCLSIAKYIVSINLLLRTYATQRPASPRQGRLRVFKLVHL